MKMFKNSYMVTLAHKIVKKGNNLKTVELSS